MRSLISVFCLIISALTINMVSAQDIIKFRDGKEVEAKIMEVTQTEIKYKKYHNIDGPLYTVGQHEVETITYAYGEVEEYGDVVAVSGNTNTMVASQIFEPQFIEPIPDENNTKMISRINRKTSQLKKKPIRQVMADVVTVKYNLTDNSIISSGDAEIVAQRNNAYVYNFSIKNKASSLLYVDLASSFRVDSNGNSMCLYDNTSTTVSTTSSSGGSLGLGAITNALGIGGIVGALANGVSLGGGSSNNLTRVHQAQRVVTIPAHGTEYIVKYTTDRGHKVSSGIGFNPGNLTTIIREDENGNRYVISNRLHRNEAKEYDEESTPYYVDFVITYSLDPEFKTYSMLKFRFYISQAFGNYIGDVGNAAFMSAYSQ